MSLHGPGCNCQRCDALRARAAAGRQLPEDAFASPAATSVNQYRPCGNSSPIAGKCPCVLPYGHGGHAHQDSEGETWPASPAAPALTITRLAAQTTERLAVLDRVRPVLSEAINAAKGEEAIQAVALLGVRIMTAILKGD